jgi:hypothetical protein
MTNQSEEEIDPLGTKEVPIIALLLMQKMSSDTSATYSSLVESYRRSYAEAQATLDLVREGIDSMLNGPYMPTPHVLTTMLWPPRESVKERAEQYIKEGFRRESW